MEEKLRERSLVVVISEKHHIRICGKVLSIKGDAVVVEADKGTQIHVSSFEDLIFVIIEDIGDLSPAQAIANNMPEILTWICLMFSDLEAEINHAHALAAENITYTG